MGILRIVMSGYGSQLYAGKITKQQKTDFENYCKKNSLDINEVWYENENDEMKEFFNVDDCLDMDDFLDIGGITFYDKTDFEKFLFGNQNSAEIIVYSELPLENHNKLNEIKLDSHNIVRHERTFHIKVCVTAQKMRAGPSEPACRSRLQTT